MIKDKVLVIDDERAIRNLISTVLSTQGYEVLTAASGTEAESLINSHSPDIIILDLGLPDMDGMSILVKTRTWSKMPIIVVSARNTEGDKVMALDAGADDYIEKPFGTRELVARVRTAIRHTRTTLENQLIAKYGKYIAGNLVVDYDKHIVQIDGRDVHLTPHEFRIVGLLAKHAGRILTYDSIICEIWGPNLKKGNQILRVHMANIRRKIEKNPASPEYIFTEIGIGYRMREPEE